MTPTKGLGLLFLLLTLLVSGCDPLTEAQIETCNANLEARASDLDGAVTAFLASPEDLTLCRNYASALTAYLDDLSDCLDNFALAADERRSLESIRSSLEDSGPICSDQ